MPTLRMRTHAKINLFLRVMGMRPDGYHEIETILHGVRYYDEIQVSSSSTGRVDVMMELAEGLEGGLPELEANLMYQAAQALLARGAHNDGAKIMVRKHVPIGSGLGGGSGNAAGVLLALNRLWETGLDRQDLAALAGQVGSDVPYFLAGGTVMATSRGEQLAPLPAPEKMWFVLGISHLPLLTRDVYELREPQEPPSSSGALMALALGAGDVTEVASLLHNDLEPAIFKLRPELEDKKASLVDAGALGVCVSGSGPTLYGVAADEGHGKDIAPLVESCFDRTIVLCSQPRSIEWLD